MSSPAQKRLEVSISFTLFVGVIADICGAGGGLTAPTCLFLWLALHLKAARPLLYGFAVLALTLVTDIIYLAVVHHSDAANTFAAFTFLAKLATTYLVYAFVTHELAERLSLLWTGVSADEGGAGVKSFVEAEGASAAHIEGGAPGAFTPPAAVSPPTNLYSGSYQ